MNSSYKIYIHNQYKNYYFLFIEFFNIKIFNKKYPLFVFWVIKKCSLKNKENNLSLN